MSAVKVRGESAACAALVRHALQSGGNEHIPLAFYALAAGALLLALAGVVMEARFFKPLMWGAIFVLFLLLIIGWAGLFGSLVRQNGGAAVLVPGIRRRSTKVLFGAWLTVMVCLTAPIAALGVPATFTVPVVGAILVIGALLVSRPVLAMLVIFGMTAPIFIEAYLMPVRPDAALAWRILLGLWAAVMAVRAMFRGRSVDTIAFSFSQYTSGQQARGVNAAYAKKLQRDSASKNGAALLPHCVGPVAAQPLDKPALMLAAVVGGALAVSMAVPSLAALARANPNTQIWFLTTAISVMLVHAHTLGATVRRTAGEQALLMLTAHRPPAAAINKLLARALMLRYASLWASLTLMVMGVWAAFGVPVAELAWVLALLLTTLAAGTLLLQNYAVARHRNASIAALLATGAAATGAAALYSHFGLVAGAYFAAGWAGVTLLIAVLRWTAMVRAPVAFPSQRLA